MLLLYYLVVEKKVPKCAGVSGFNNIVVTAIQLCAFVGVNYSNCVTNISALLQNETRYFDVFS